MWTVPGLHWQIGGAFVIAVAAALVGVVFFLYCRYVQPGAPYFRKQTLTRATPTLVPDKSLTRPAAVAQPRRATAVSAVVP